MRQELSEGNGRAVWRDLQRWENHAITLAHKLREVKQDAPRQSATALPVQLDQLRVEGDVGVVGEELGDGAARLRVRRGLVELLFGCAGNGGGGSQSNLGDGKAAIGLGQGDGGVGLDLVGRQSGTPQLRSQRH